MSLVHRSRYAIAGILVGASLALGAAAQYTVGSATGPFPVPTSGPGGSTPGMNWGLPSLPQTIDLTRVPLTAPGVPAGALNVKSVKIYNFSHTWIGDLTIVLQNPSGLKYTLMARPGSDGATFGADGDFVNSDITFVDPSTPGALDVPLVNGTDMVTGTYKQQFNPTWSLPNQLAVIANTDMSAIPMVPGVWKLTIYDWYPADSGSFDRWEMSGDSGAAPTPYCTSGTSTNACAPSIAANFNPNVAHTGSCVITVSGVEGQKSGIIFYGINNTGFTPSAWGAGSSSFLCVKGPTQRMGVLNSGGAVGACNGTLVQDFNAYLIANPGSLGQPFSAGNDVFVQGWYRDPPAVKTTNLSNALKMTFQ